jgi:hypothetical protein
MVNFVWESLENQRLFGWSVSAPRMSQLPGGEVTGRTTVCSGYGIGTGQNASQRVMVV